MNHNDENPNIKENPMKICMSSGFIKLKKTLSNNLPLIETKKIIKALLTINVPNKILF